MPNPQQPEMRRSGRTALTEEPPDSKSAKGKARAHGTDKGAKGGGKGGGTPPEQKPPHPA